jgi:hypothetical protein
MINESAYRYLLEKLRHASNMVSVIVSDEHVIDLLEAGALDGFRDAISISIIKSWPPSIYKKGLAGGSDE